ncbi:MAG: pyruvate ferredoxin oxidoreductase gamma subunit [Clostridia bacterium]|nr:pyruvate ferredoxin oxidoreductase gamma subunit [Clostridia bacterium]
MQQVRWHGRGGQGAVTAAKILGMAAVYEGKYAQSFPAFGTERRGAPVQAFTRIADRPIRDRSQVYNPDYIVILDPSLLRVVDVLAGLRSGGTIVLNAPVLPAGFIIPPGSHLVLFHATPLALEVLGSPIVNTIMAGALAGATSLVGLEALKRAVIDVLPEKVAEKNLYLVIRAYEQVAGAGRREVHLAVGNN